MNASQQTALSAQQNNNASTDVQQEYMMTRKDIMKLLGISPPTLRKAIDDGTFPKPANIAGQDRWPSSLVHRYIHQAAETSNQPHAGETTNA